MDRIRKALDLARLDRGERPSPVRTEPGVIEYRTTRSYDPPADLFERNRIIDPKRNHSAAAAFRMLRTQVLQRMNERSWRSIAMLSPNAEDGKTTTAINLAISLAYDQRHTTLLVDCDLKQPKLAKLLGISPDAGIEDVIAGSASVADCLYHPTGFDRLVLLPARQAIAHSSEALSGHKARELVKELHDRYPDRIIVFDLPPIIGADDALAFLPLVDCGLMVVAEGVTRREDLVRCMHLVSKSPIVGTVLNKASVVTPAYG